MVLNTNQDQTESGTYVYVHLTVIHVPKLSGMGPCVWLHPCHAPFRRHYPELQPHLRHVWVCSTDKVFKPKITSDTFRVMLHFPCRQSGALHLSASSVPHVASESLTDPETGRIQASVRPVIRWHHKGLLGMTRESPKKLWRQITSYPQRDILYSVMILAG